MLYVFISVWALCFMQVLNKNDFVIPIECKIGMSIFFVFAIIRAIYLHFFG